MAARLRLRPAHLRPLRLPSLLRCLRPRAAPPLLTRLWWARSTRRPPPARRTAPPGILAFNTGFLVLTGTAAILVIVFVFRNMPVAIESGTTTLLQIDNSIEEASTILGAGSGYSFRRISLPMLRNAFFSGLVYSFVKAITAVSAIIFLVSPRWDLVTSKIYTLFDQAKYSQAAAFVTMMVVILLVFIGIFNGLINLLLAPRSRVPKGAGIHEKTEETK